MTALSTFVIRCRGLPWSCTEDDLKRFFCGGNAADEIVKLCLTVNEVGKPTGEAYIQFSTEAQLQNAMKKNKECIGKRYVEIFRSTLKEMEFVMNHSSKEAAADRKKGGINSLLDSRDMIVRLRGLPFGVWPDDLISFFEGIRINSSYTVCYTSVFGVLGLDIIQDGIYIVNESSRQTGDAFVQFANVDSYEKALAKDRQTVGHRYVEVFPSSYDEVNRFKRKYETGGDDFRQDYDEYGMGGKRKYGKFGRGGGGSFRDLFDDFDDSDFGSRGGPPSRYGMLGGGFGRNPMYGNGGGMGSSMMGAGGYMPTEYPMRESYGRQRPVGAPIGSGFGGPALSAAAPFGTSNNGNGMPYTNFESSGGRQQSIGGGGGKPLAGDKPLKHYVFMRGLPPKCGHEDIIQDLEPGTITALCVNPPANQRTIHEALINKMQIKTKLEALQKICIVAQDA
uniref:RRM domain-containing protein n=1 Tax=Romanomermis culicivorax TaxID=13658 RepID=A0A915KXC6_ROMCU